MQPGKVRCEWEGGGEEGEVKEEEEGGEGGVGGARKEWEKHVEERKFAAKLNSDN